MKKLGLFLLLGISCLALTGCPGSSRNGGQPITLDGFYKPTPGDAVAQDASIPLDVGGDVVVPPQPCGSDEECPDGYCHPEWNVCVECYEDAHCHNGICIDSVCVEQPECAADKPCPDGLYCDYDLMLCVECLGDEHCPEGFECLNHTCTEKKPPCDSDEDCPEGLVCNTHNNECVECLTDEQCPVSEWCYIAQGVCLDDLCEPGVTVCVSGGTKTCKENGSGYGETALCPEGTVCEEGACIPVALCVPGESFCVTENAFKICNEDGSTWSTWDCPADEPFCEDFDGHAQCTGKCEPVCELPPNFCGPDLAGCGTLCDACMPGYDCPEGALGLPPGEFVPCEDTCSCENKQCGDDGCGESCGECKPGYLCQAGQCIYLGYTCAEGYKCIQSCDVQPADACLEACVAGTIPEQQGLLLDLVECVLGFCDGWVPGCAEEAAAGPCAKLADQCLSCQPNCFGKECGSDGCGGQCGYCPDGFACKQGQCIGQGSCEGILKCIEASSAPPDVAIPMCMAPATPDAQAQFMKLAGCVEDLCNNFQPYTECYMEAIQGPCAKLYNACTDCVPWCTGKECGPDGCGGWCGFCDEGFDCADGKCVCIPNCQGKECGSDGCGNLCGVCPPNFTCTPWGKCDCTPQCVGKECGNDGCGGTCGFCAPNVEYCSEMGNCIPYQCLPGEMICDGNVPLICGPDGDWTALGPCPAGSFCQKGACVPWVCEPGDTKCEGNGVAKCAANGGGWLPPEFCPAGTKCQAGQCIPTTGCGDIPKVGCCDGTTFMLCTDDGVIKVEECGPMGCGWIPNWGYGCGGMGEDPSGQFPIACPGTCQPQCINADGTVKECGADGCGDVCGICPPDHVCANGQCEPFCIPQCQGKECGSDQCGGVCGICAPDESCQNGKCVVPVTCAALIDCAAGCFPMGDECFAMCTAGADQSSPEYAEFKKVWSCVANACPANAPDTCFKSALFNGCYQLYLACVSCQPQCVDEAGMVKECGPDGCGGSCGACPENHDCVSGQCLPVCVPQCAGKQCGDNGCGGQCGICKPGYECENGQCIYICKPQCVGKQCGPDGCGGQCGYCKEGFQCSDFGICVPLAICGDGICEPEEGEGCTTCPKDCGECSNGCEPTPFPGCGGCSCEECVCAMDPFCCEVQWDSLCVEECYECGGCCEPNCVGKQCGPDGCGGKCGSCPPDYTCKNGQCEVVCIPDCDGKECGSDGCGGTCGTCPVDETCKNSVCFAGKPCGELIECSMSCVAQSGAECLFDCLEEGTPEAQDEFFDLVQCILWQCGLNLDAACMLGAMNGACKAEYNTCKQCVPDCANKQCGPDGCNGICGKCAEGYYCDNYKCKPVCTPNCTGKECGSNGCGGSCGSCADDEECTNGLCVPVCVPNCANKQCGSDGCGGLCGTCPPSFICQNSLCVPVGPLCGDGECNFWDGEDCKSCPEDCGDCTDGCSPTNYPGCNGCKCEACVCEMDPYCCDVQWDSICVNECKECGGCGGCVPQCAGKECGTDGCGGSCGFCKPGFTCKAGTCVESCQPDCLGKSCGPDGCGGTCGSCPDGFKCDANSKCVPYCIPDCDGKECGPDGCNGICGLCGPDELCLTGSCQVAWDCETLLNCLWDCTEGDEACTTACWTKASPEAQEQYILIWECILDVCGPEPVEPCPGQAILYGECKDEFNACLDCTPTCTGKQCGSDGCGGECGECPPGYECDIYGYCDCIPSCANKECGNDGCGGSCGECPGGSICNLYGKCICLPNCQGKECGSDGCGGSCGKCPVGFVCEKGLCVEDCIPQCVGADGTPKQCGPDGCGGVCGYCPPGLACNAQGQCQQTGPVCGDGQCDGDGENCLTCPKDCGQCGGDCCNAHDGVGCEDPVVTKCVCAMDPFCCDVNWDGICANEAKDQCGADCGCTPNCAGKQCGADGCGGSCGTCKSGYTCNSQGQCIQVCVPKCDGKQCGADGCGGTCGTCPVGSQCNTQGQCICVPNCNGKECGPDGCGGSCGTCGQFQTCTGSGKCAFVTPLCGDNNCMAMIGENCDSCPQDCGKCCGNGQCQPAYQENCYSCPADCGSCCGNGFCETPYGETCTSCPGDCGPCPAVCGDGLCDEDAGESCTNCPGDCGPCPTACGDGICDPDEENCIECPGDCGPCKGDCCEPNGSVGCEDPEVTKCVCGMDPYCCNVTWDGICANEAEEQCGADCGCTPACDNKECGADGCGGSCGECPPGFSCNNQGLCIPGPQGESCSEVFACATSCAGDMNCIFECNANGTPEAQGLFMALMECIFKSCGPAPSTQCMIQAIMMSCNTEYNACLAD